MKARLARLRGAITHISLTRALVALATVVVGINVAAAVWDIRAERGQTERRAQRDFTNLTRLLAEQTAASLDAADLILREAARAGDAAAVAERMARLQGELAHVPQIAALLVADEQGRVLAQTNDATLGSEVASQPFFTLQKADGTQGAIVSEPFFGGMPWTASWRFVISRRLETADAAQGGSFGGIVAAVVEIRSFERLYRTIDLGEGGFITLLTAQGALITRVPNLPDIRGRKFPGHELIEGIHREGRFEGWFTSPIIGEQVLVSASDVRTFPLLVVTGATEASVLAPWRDQAWVIGWRTLLTSAAMLLLIGVAAWGLARRERLLARRETRFSAMIERSADGVLLSRPGAGGIVWASPSVERMTGHSPHSLLGREAIELVHPEQREAAARMREEVLRTPGKVVTVELLIRKSDGSGMWIENTVSNLLHDPAVGALVLNFRDITERKLAEAERARLGQRLRQAEKMEAVGRLAGGIAHDFNNILGGILGYAEMLVEGTVEGSRERRYAQNVLTAATRASDLVEQILSYSRSQRGKRQPVDIDRVVAETLELVRGTLPDGIRLHAGLDGQPRFVVGDPTQLHQIVMNLCTNAVHAMEDAGVLSVSLDSVDVPAERALSHSTLQPGHYIRLVVADNGTGMDEATLARVFEPFFTTKEVGKGTGLGLSLVYGIVTDSAGAIDVASAPGRGSRFAIFLPRVESPAVVEDEGAGPVARGNGERVIVVDDEDALLALAAEVLRRLGYQPATFPTGEAALKAFCAAPQEFDAVITDEIMPGLTGTELAQSMRALRADLPIVLISGYIGPVMTERALAAGVSEILKKPVQARELAAALSRVLEPA